MAAYLNIANLRRHALPAHVMTDFGRAIDRRCPLGFRPGSGERPGLSAAWRVDAAGRLVCGWQVRAAEPDFPSG